MTKARRREVHFLVLASCCAFVLLGALPLAAHATATGLQDPTLDKSDSMVQASLLSEVRHLRPAWLRLSVYCVPIGAGSGSLR